MNENLLKFCTYLCAEQGIHLTKWQMAFLEKLVSARRPIIKKGRVVSSRFPNKDITEWCIDMIRRIANIPYGNLSQMTILDEVFFS